MKHLQNENSADRIIRIIAGIVLGLSALVFVTGNMQIILYIAAVILLATGFIGFCPIYKILGIKTTK